MTKSGPLQERTRLASGFPGPVPAAHLQIGDKDVLSDGHRGNEAELLLNHGNRGTLPGKVVGRDSLPIETKLAGVELDPSGNDADEGALSSAVLPKKRHNFPGTDRNA